MTQDELAQELQKMRLNAPEGDKTPFTHLFAIRHATVLTGWTIAELGDLCVKADAPPSMGTELHKMVKLAKYVVEKTN